MGDTPNRFAILPDGLEVDLKAGLLQHQDIALYYVMRLNWGGYEAIFPGQELIAKRSAMSVSSVKRCLARLKERGWLIIERQKRANGNNIYWICDFPHVKPKKHKVSDVNYKKS